MLFFLQRECKFRYLIIVSFIKSGIPRGFFYIFKNSGEFLNDSSKLLFWFEKTPQTVKCQETDGNIWYSHAIANIFTYQFLLKSTAYKAIFLIFNHWINHFPIPLSASSLLYFPILLCKEENWLILTAQVTAVCVKDSPWAWWRPKKSSVKLYLFFFLGAGSRPRWGCGFASCVESETISIF